MKYFLFFCFTITSCIDTAKTLPSSTGKNSELIFVIDDALWTSSVALLSKKVFSTEIIGINQREPLFNTIQVNNTRETRKHKATQNINTTTNKTTKDERRTTKNKKGKQKKTNTIK